MDTTKTLYDTDFVAWADRTAGLLRAGRFNEIEVENVAEEIETLGRSERKGVRSHLQRLMMHKMKQRIQPERDGPSWQLSIAEARQSIQDDIEESPSLRRHLEDNLQKLYVRAIEEALIETRLTYSPFPKLCPWTLDDLLGS